MQHQPPAAVVDLHVGERRVADDGIDAALGQPGVAEILDADVGVGVQGTGDAARHGIQLDADEPHASRGLGHEVADAAAGFEHRGPVGHAEAGQGGVHGRHDDGRGEELAERRPLGRIVLLFGEQGFELVAEGLPAVLVAAGDRVGEQRQRHRPEAAEAGERIPFLVGRRAVLPLDVLQGADGGEEVAGLGLLAGGEGGRRR